MKKTLFIFIFFSLFFVNKQTSASFAAVAQCTAGISQCDSYNTNQIYKGYWPVTTVMTSATGFKCQTVQGNSLYSGGCGSQPMGCGTQTSIDVNATKDQYNVCTCKTGFIQSGSRCVPDNTPDCNAGSQTGGNYYDTTTQQCKSDPNLTLCISETTNIWCPISQACSAPGVICAGPSSAIPGQGSPGGEGGGSTAASGSPGSSGTSGAGGGGTGGTAGDSGGGGVGGTGGSAGSTAGAGGNGGAGGGGGIGGEGGQGGDGGVGGEGGEGGMGGQGGVTDLTPVVVAIDASTQAIVGAINAGGGSGNGEGGTCPDCAKESTLQAVKNAVTTDQSANTYQSPANIHNQGSFSQNQADAEAEFENQKQQLLVKVDEIKTGFSQIFTNAITSGFSQLPVYNFGNMKGVDVVFDLNQYASQLNVISTLILALAFLIALSIVLKGD